MKPNHKYIHSLVFKQGWTDTEFAEKMCVSRSMVNRFFNGKRNGGAKFIGNLLRVFPNEPIEKLFFLDLVLQNSNDTAERSTNDNAHLHIAVENRTSKCFKRSGK